MILKKIPNLLLAILSLILFILILELFFSILEKYHHTQPIKLNYHSLKNEVPKPIIDKLLINYPNFYKETESNLKKQNFTNSRKSKIYTPDKRKHISNKKTALNSFIPNSTYNLKLTNLDTNQVVYKVKYNIDQYGRRVVPEESDNPKKHLLLIGDSYTWGEGVKGSETFVNLLQKKYKKFQVYQNSMPGFGPNDLYQVAKNDGWAFQGIKQKNGIAIYTIIDAHFFRAYPSSLWLAKANFLKYKPFYDNSQGLKFIDTMENNFPLLLLLGKSSLLKFFKISLPLNHKKKSVELVFDLLVGLEKELKTKHGTIELILAFASKADRGLNLEKKWVSSGRKIIDFTKYELPEHKRFFILNDGHMNKYGHFIMSEIYSQEIEHYFNSF